MLEVFPPWQVEMLGQADLPHETLTEVVSRFFGYIPIQRGRVERESLEMALDVLRQNGVIGIYPEGGIWDAGAMRAHTGVSWLSYRGNSPVLPIGFSGTGGALGTALRLKRPKMSMYIGELIPAASPDKEIPRKLYFQNYATKVMNAIQSLIPENDKPQRNFIKDERFELEIEVRSAEGKSIDYPVHLQIKHDQALTKILHRPGILKIFRSNLALPTEALERLDDKPDVREIDLATRSIIRYLREDNPYLLTYRFGAKEAEAMLLGLTELNALTEWVILRGYSLKLKPVRRYFVTNSDEEMIQIKQGKFEDWM